MLPNISLAAKNGILNPGLTIGAKRRPRWGFGARFYDSDIGRWWSVDPLADEEAGLTPYPDVRNPMKSIDPAGRTTFNGDTKIVEDWIKNENEALQDPNRKYTYPEICFD